MKKVAIQMSGGIGDAIIALGSAAPHYMHCNLVGVVREHQVPLMRNFMGYQKIISDHKMRNLGYYRTFDEVINFAGFLTTTRTLRTDDYYQCAEEKLGKPVKEPGFWSFPEGAERVWQDTVAIHPGASNPNRS
jgi:hypothetical protein